MAKSDHFREAAKAMAHLHVLAGVVAMLQGGTIQGGGSADRTAQKIIRLCRAEQQRQLGIYDRERGKAEGGPGRG